MDLRIEPHPLGGAIRAIASKSVAHRLLILATLGKGVTELVLADSSDDIEATMRCLRALGATITRADAGVRVMPLEVGKEDSAASLDVGESGSTLRFLLPIVAALGRQASFRCHGRLAQRPLAPLDEQLTRHGMELQWVDDSTLAVSGTLQPGSFELPGSVSSQYISGLLMAAPLLGEDFELFVSQPVESRGYIDLTIDALARYGVLVVQDEVEREGRGYLRLVVPANARLVSPGSCPVEGDWSNAAFWLAAGALGPHQVDVTGVNTRSTQGDRAIMGALALLGCRIGRQAQAVTAKRDALRGATIDVSGIPDLAVPLSAVAAYAKGTTYLTGAARLRLKESDRLESIRAALCGLGGSAAIVDEGLEIQGMEQLPGGEVDACRDHRIAMMAAVCAAYATGPSVIRGAECVAKSYPHFFDDFRALGGIAYEVEA